MKALEFQTTLNPDHTLTVPSDIVAQVSSASSLRIIVLMPEQREDDEAWNRLAASQFLEGYSESDSIYDNL